MADPTPNSIAAALLASGFDRDGAPASTLSDPIAETPMVVTLDQLRPYDRDPRLTRNPKYDDIKASIRVRGLDAPPPITRRPGDAHYIIRNGGNSRLSILRELWTETRDERFFRLACRFIPWPERGEIVALTGHLAENELRGGLTFIERAMGVQAARTLYEQEAGQKLSQSELARRLSADGFPVQQSHISRMQDAVRYLLPAIPTLLYGGLGRHQVERLSVLRNACARVWERRATGKSLSSDFPSLFQDVLSQFDSAPPEQLASRRLQDELVGQMAEMLGTDYDTLTLEIDDGEARQRALTSDPTPTQPTQPLSSAAHPIQLAPPARPAADLAKQHSNAGALPTKQTRAGAQVVDPEAGPPAESATAHPSPGEPPAAFLQEHIASQAATTQRLQSIQHLVAEQMGDPAPSFEADVLRSIPVQAGGLYPISDVWYIDPGLDSPDRLRVHIAQFANEIAEECAAAAYIHPCDSGLGFVCLVEGAARAMDARTQAVLALLHALTACPAPSTGIATARLATDLAPLLHGHGGELPRLSDTSLVKLFRLLRLARRLLDLGAAADFPGSDSIPDA